MRKQVYCGLALFGLAFAMPLPAVAQVRHVPRAEPRKPDTLTTPAPVLTTGINRADDKPPPKEPEPKPEPKPGPKDGSRLHGVGTPATAAPRLTTGVNRADGKVKPDPKPEPKPGTKDATRLRGGGTPVTVAPRLGTGVNRADDKPKPEPKPQPKYLQGGTARTPGARGAPGGTGDERGASAPSPLSGSTPPRR